jgi:SAM-dependent methyltransferase
VNAHIQGKFTFKKLINITYGGDMYYRSRLKIRIILLYEMNDNGKKIPRSVSRLTAQNLQILKAQGFRFVLVKGVTGDRRTDYITFSHFTLTPVKELPGETARKEIFEPIDSEILLQWANCQDDRVAVYIENQASEPATDYFHSDTEFNALYPLPIQALAKNHWTPLAIALQAAKFLTHGGQVRILDIGSGVGKFCFAGAHTHPLASFCGIEQRKSLFDHAESAKRRLGLKNVSFIHGNFTQLDLSGYDHFYFYNSFYENLAFTDQIDDTVEYSGELYNYYTRYLSRQLQKKPKGTRLCTLSSIDDEIPSGYERMHADAGDPLKYWIKV